MLRAGTLADIARLGRTPDAPAWTREVEEFIAERGARDALLGASTGLLIYEAQQPVGVAFIKPHDDFHGAALLQTFALGYAHRGRGLARHALRMVLEATEATERPHIMWLVHPLNTPMQTITHSESHDVEPGAGADGYDLFIFDR